MYIILKCSNEDFFVFSQTSIQNQTQENQTVPEESKLTNETKVDNNLDSENTTKQNSVNNIEESSGQEKEKEIFKVKDLKSEKSKSKGNDSETFNEELVFIDPDEFKVDENSLGPPLDESGNDIHKMSKKIVN